jgi:hypothetical protein
MSIEQLSRRTVTRGVAWSLPVVAVGIAAPAFAVSGPAPVAADAQGSCKCPGGNAPYIFKSLLSFTAPAGSSWTLSFQAVLFDGTAPTSFTPSTAIIPAIGGNVQFVLQNPLNNSANSHDVTITYTAQNNTTNEVFGPFTTSFLGVAFPPCKGANAC